MTLTRNPPLIDAGRLPTRAMTDAETYLKRKTFALEAASVRRMQALYFEAYRDLSALVDGSGNRADSERAVAARLTRLRDDVLALLGLTVRAALLGGYFGKLWLLDMATKADVPVNIQRFLSQHVHALTDTAVIDQMLGKPYRDQIDVEMDALGLDVRRVLIAGATGLAAAALRRRLRTSMGVDRSRDTFHGNFNRVQVLARTATQSAVNTGAVTAMQGNAALVDGLEWCTSNDERVCFRCAPLDGKRFPLNTDFRPPLHEQCRCTLVPLVDDAAQTTPTTPLRQTFPQWLLTIDVRGDVDGYLNPKT